MTIAEHAAVDADAEREGQDRREREPGAVAQRPQRKARVLDEVVEPPPSPGVARLVPQAQGVAEGSRIPHQRTVRFHLAAQFVVHGAAAEQVVETTDPFTDERHRDPHASSSNKPIALVVRRYSAISASSCFRPLAVMRYSRTCRPDSDSRHAAFTQPLISSFWSAG